MADETTPDPQDAVRAHVEQLLNEMGQGGGAAAKELLPEARGVCREPLLVLVLANYPPALRDVLAQIVAQAVAGTTGMGTNTLFGVFVVPVAAGAPLAEHLREWPAIEQGSARGGTPMVAITIAATALGWLEAPSLIIAPPGFVGG